MRRATAGMGDLIGKDSIGTIVAVSQLALTLDLRGKCQEALPLYRRALDWVHNHERYEQHLMVQAMRHRYQSILNQTRKAPNEV